MAESSLLITDAELLNLGLPAGALTGVAEPVRDEHRATASNEALSYLKKRYKLPIVSSGSDVKQAVAAIAAQSIMGFRGYDPASKSGEQIDQRAQRARDWLRDVSKGLVEPVDLVDSTPDTDEEAPLVASDDTAGWTWPTAASNCEDDRTGFN